MAGSEYAAARQRGRRPVAHDQMVEQPYVDQRESGLEALRDLLIRWARFGDAAGVIVGENYSRRVYRQRLFDDFSGVHARAVDRAAEQFGETNDPMPIVEKQAAKYFERKVVQLRSDVTLRRPRVANLVAGLHALGEVPACQLWQPIQRCASCRS